MAESLNDIIKKYDINVSLEDFKRKREQMLQNQCKMHPKHRSVGTKSTNSNNKRKRQRESKSIFN